MVRRYIWKKQPTFWPTEACESSKKTRKTTMGRRHRVGFIQTLLQRMKPSKVSPHTGETHEVVWNVTKAREASKQNVLPFTPRPDKPRALYVSKHDREYQRKRHEILKQLEGD